MEVILIPFVAFACAIWAYNVAEARGHSGVLWFFIGMFTGLFGLIGSCLLTDKTKDGQQE